VNTDAPWPDANTARQRVLKIQTKLHQWATDDPGRRFDDLWNLVYDPAVPVEAWHRVRSNRGARTAGVDGETAYYVMTVRASRPSSPSCEMNSRLGSSSRFPYAK
jgi:RNA-directed DNA polymerase